MKKVVLFVFLISLAFAGQAFAYTCTGVVFNDVDATSEPIFCAFIEEFATLGITGGCGGGNYCPAGNVTRGQMAVFFVTALDSVANSRYVNVTGDTMTGFLRFGNFYIGMDSGNLRISGPASLLAPPSKDVIVFGDYNCIGTPCLPTRTHTEVKLGETNSDAVTFGTDDVAFENPQTRYWSILGSDFIPYDETYTYNKVLGTIRSTTGQFSAPVHLPHGAVVTKMTVHYWDNSLDSFGVALERWNLRGSGSTMAGITTADTGAAWGSGEDTTIASATIDNTANAYRLWFSSMDGTDNHRLGGVVIEYTVTSPLP